MARYANSQVHGWSILDKLASHEPPVKSFAQMVSIYQQLGEHAQSDFIERLELSYPNTKKFESLLLNAIVQKENLSLKANSAPYF
jgi:hypothetical protein